MRRLLLRSVGWLVAGLTWLLARTCRRTIVADPRPALRAAGTPYVYALLHAHQVTAVLAADDPGLVAMVSRSTDGDLLVPALRLHGMAAVRGSTRTRTRDKGGLQALGQLIALVRAGRPALLAVDGPRGPRNRVQRGVVALAQRSGATILPLVVLASRRTILRRTWDRLQLPWPGSRIRMIFGPPIACGDAREGAAAVQTAVAAALVGLEIQHDPSEAARGQRGTDHVAA